MRARLAEAADGEIGELPSVDAVVDELLSMLMGLQILGVLSPREATPRRQLGQLDEFFVRLRA